MTIRPIRPEDAGLEQDFVRNLSPESRYLRFLRTLTELTPEMLERYTRVDYDRDMALIACVPRDGREVEVGVARFTADECRGTCEFAVAVADEWQGRGLGTRLMRELLREARVRGLRLMAGQVLACNTDMLGLVRDLGFAVRPGDDPGVRTVTKELRPPVQRPSVPGGPKSPRAPRSTAPGLRNGTP